jgi:predicted enzyme related to lactoylglutathione lyase
MAESERVSTARGYPRWDAPVSTRTSPWPEGVPCWTDLTVPDVRTAIDFYSAVLGWEFADPDPEYGGYAIASVKGHPVAGVGPQMQFGVPATWTLYLAADSVDDVAGRITGSGGTMLLPPGDVGPLGRLLVAADPSGAVFGCWQAGTHIGAGLVNEPGGLTWEDLRSSAPGAAQEFYRSVFGYRTEPMAEAGPDYALFFRGDEQAPLGGMGPTFGEDRPSHWLVYFGVADTRAAAAASEQAGGRVLNPVFDTPYGPMATLADPAGAVFAVVQSSAAEQPDRSG